MEFEKLRSLSEKREKKMVENYNAAQAELEAKIDSKELKIVYWITAGCIDDEVTKELCNRFIKDGFKASAESSGWFTGSKIKIEIGIPTQTVVEQKLESSI